MEVTIPDYKRDQVVELLATWTVRDSYTILEAAELLGQLNHLSEICRWARSRYFALQNDMRRALRTRYFALRGLRLRHAEQIAAWEVELPGPLVARLEPLIQREIAAVLWRTKQAILVTPFARQELVYLHTYLADRCNPWSISISHIVKRNPTFTTTGDASNLGGGAHCRDLQFWFSYI